MHFSSMSELREFVYIDDVSVNSHLSSLGRGIPQEVIRTAEDESEKAGEGGLKFWEVGAKGRYSSIDRSGLEKTLSITEPYRIEDLLNALDEEGIEVYENPDPRSLARGDVVRLEGEAIPMSLFKFEVAIEAVQEFLNTSTKESLEDLDDSGQDHPGEELNEEELTQLDVFQDLLETFTGDAIPLSN